MPREPLSLVDDAMRRLVGVLAAHASDGKLPTGASAQLTVAPRGSGFCFGFDGAKQGTDVDFFMTMGALHAVKVNPPDWFLKFIFKVAHYRTPGVVLDGK